MTSAILLMGGRGDRFSSDRPKQFHILSGKKVYLHTLETFLESGLFEEIILVCAEKWISSVEDDLKHYSRSGMRVIPGGQTRQESSYRGILACRPTTKYVVIHDAVRPFVAQTILTANIEALRCHSAVDTCIPSVDTLVYTKTGDMIDQIPKRAEYMRGQTPQSFERSLILQAHERAKAVGLENSSDDCRLVLEMNHPVHIVQGDEQNIKITSTLDLFVAEQLFRMSKTPALTSTAHSLLKKRYAVVGGTGGIGTAVVAALKKEGAIPLTISKSASDYSADFTDDVQVEHLFQQITLEYGPLDGVINTIGMLEVKPFSSLCAAEIHRAIATNLTALIFSCRFAMLKAGGHVINIASSAYFRGRTGYAVYSATKAAAVNFTQALAGEWPHLCINAVIPCRTDTPLRRQNFPNEDTSTLLPPEKVADTIITLLKQTHITGSLIEVKHNP